MKYEASDKQKKTNYEIKQRLCSMSSKCSELPCRPKKTN